MTADHFEILVEEQSMEVFLQQILPKILKGRATFQIHSHGGKSDLLGKLQSKLRGYAKWLPESYRIVVLIDRDNADCNALKAHLNAAAEEAGLATRTASPIAWQVANRIAIEELEAWFFGEWTAVQKAYQRVAATIPAQAPYRHPDAIAGGTWEALERILKGSGYFSGGLRKLEVARAIGRDFDPAKCSSPSFIFFRTAIEEATT